MTYLLIGDTPSEEVSSSESGGKSKERATEAGAGAATRGGARLVGMTVRTADCLVFETDLWMTRRTWTVWETGLLVPFAFFGLVALGMVNGYVA